MGNYASAYEEYYKNINSRFKEKSSDYKNNKYEKYKLHSDNKNYFSKEYWIVKIEHQLLGSILLLSFFMVLKYGNIPNIKGIYSACKNSLISQFDYDESIEAFNSMDIYGYKAKDFRIGPFKIEDLKSQNLKVGWNNFINSIRQSEGQEI